MNATSTATPVGALPSNSFLPVVFLTPSPSQPQSQSISPVNPDQVQPSINVSINLPQPREDNAIQSAIQAYYAGVDDISKVSILRARKKEKDNTLGFWKTLAISAATVGAVIAGLHLLSGPGRSAIREKRQALFNKHLPIVEKEQSPTISFKDFLKEHKDNLGSSGQLRTALVEMAKLGGESEYFHTVLLGDSVYVHNDISAKERSIFALQKDLKGNIVLEKKSIENDLPILRVHSHPMQIKENGELNFMSPLHSIFEGIKGTLIQAFGGDFNPSKPLVEQTHFSDRVPLYANYNNNSDGIFNTWLAFDIGMNLASALRSPVA